MCWITDFSHQPTVNSTVPGHTETERLVYEHNSSLQVLCSHFGFYRDKLERGG